MVTLPELPPHTTALPVIDAVGKAFTLTAAVPLRPPIAAQFASLNELTVYDVDAEGVTETTTGFVEVENDCPLDSVPLQGPLPVRFIESEELLPAHISALPVSKAVGLAMVVMATLELLATGHGVLVATTR